MALTNFGAEKLKNGCLLIRKFKKDWRKIRCDSQMTQRLFLTKMSLKKILLGSSHNVAVFRITLCRIKDTKLKMPSKLTSKKWNFVFLSSHLKRHLILPTFGGYVHWSCSLRLSRGSVCSFMDEHFLISQDSSQRNRKIQMILQFRKKRSKSKTKH